MRKVGTGITCCPSSVLRCRASAISSGVEKSSMRKIFDISSSPSVFAIFATIASDVPKIIIDLIPLSVIAFFTLSLCFGSIKSARLTDARRVGSAFAEVPAIIRLSAIKSPSSIIASIPFCLATVIAL